MGSQNVFFIADGCGLLIQAVTYFTFPETLELERRRPYHLTCGSPGSTLPIFVRGRAQLCVFKALQRTPIFQRGGCPHGRFKSAAAQTSFWTEEEFHPHGGALSMIEMPEVRRVHCVRR